MAIVPESPSKYYNNITNEIVKNWICGKNAYKLFNDAISGRPIKNTDITIPRVGSNDWSKRHSASPK